MKNKVLAILDRMIEDSEDIIEFIKPVLTSADYDVAKNHIPSILEYLRQ